MGRKPSVQNTQIRRFFDPMLANIAHVFYVICVNFCKKLLETSKCSSGHAECSFDNPAKEFAKNAKKMEAYENFTKNMLSRGVVVDRFFWFQFILTNTCQPS